MARPLRRTEFWTHRDCSREGHYSAPGSFLLPIRLLATFCLAAGCAVDEEILLRELEMLKIDQNRIIVDPRAVIVTEEDREAERLELKDIASTCSGTGAASRRRMSRRRDVSLVQDSEELRARCRIESVAPLVHRSLVNGGDVIVEGTQGFSLSLLHGPDYPFVTSRDTTAARILLYGSGTLAKSESIRLSWWFERSRFEWEDLVDRLLRKSPGRRSREFLARQTSFLSTRQ